MKLVYVMDPLCGWCYGNTRNTEKLFTEFANEIEFDILPAGMWTGSQIKRQEKNMAAFFEKTDKQIAQKTGTQFSKAYFELLQDERILLNSEVPSRAIVCVKVVCPEKAIPFAIEVQKARYMYGKDLNKEETYTTICELLHINSDNFLTSFGSEEMKQQTQETFRIASNYAHSYPTLLLEKETEFFIVEQGFAPYAEIVESIKRIRN